MNKIKEQVNPKLLIVVGVILVAVLYYAFVHVPLGNKMESLESQIAQLEEDKALAQAKVDSLKQMQGELAETDTSADAVALATWDNTDQVTEELSSILDDASSYGIDFGDAVNSNGIYTRQIEITFTTGSVEDAVAKLQAMADSKNRYFIDSVSIASSDEGCSVQLTLVESEVAS